MNFYKKGASRIMHVSQAIIRYPLSSLCFLILVLLAMVSIHSDGSTIFDIETLAMLIGGIAAFTGQAIYERFFRGNQLIRWGIYIGVILFISLYYWLFLRNHTEINIPTYVRSSALISALVVAYIWIPSIKNKLSFSTSFTTIIKGYFISLLFSIVLEIGILAILTAFSLLIFDLDSRVYFDLTVLIFGLFAPLYFLSYIPLYQINGKGLSEKDKQAILVPKFLEILISYIIMPLLAAYSLILLLYIVSNLGGQFWNNNLLEPLLVSYVIIGFIILFLSERIESKSAVIFNKSFPKILLVIAMLQTIASLLKINQFGLTHGRYYVIMFGVFAIISSIIYSFVQNKQNYVPALFVIMSIVSIIPPIDAITVGLNAQINFAEDILRENNMLVDNTIVKNEDISLSDREKVASSIEYLYNTDGVKLVDWLPNNFDIYYEDFENTFGFNHYDYTFTDDSNNQDFDSNTAEYAIVSLNDNETFSVTTENTDQFFYVSINNTEYVSVPEQNVPFDINNDDFILQVLSNDQTFAIKVLNNQNDETINFDLKFLLNDTFEYLPEVQQLPIDDLTFTKENQEGSIKVIVKNLETHADGTYSGKMYVFVSLNI